MGEVRERTSPSDSNEKQGKHENEKHVKHEKRNFSFLARKSRPISVGSSADLSASMSSMDLASLAEHDECSTRDVSGDWATGSDAEPAARASTSDSDGNGNHMHNWNFLTLLKKGSTRFHPLTKLQPKASSKKSKRVKESDLANDTDLCYLKSAWKAFSLADLEAATNNFSTENMIGEGGYAKVYRGQLEDGQAIAVKRLNSGAPEEITMDFLSELGVIVHVNHPNIAKLIGYGVEGGMHLVLQLSPHGSLASLLYGDREILTWGIRYKVALGTAEGLLYLHEDCQRRIIHKDIKASNILLTEDFDPQITDFGLSKWLPDQWTHHTVSKVEGTFGYLPPEFFMQGIVDEKTDVYAYGVLLLELITGRQALDKSQKSLVMWAKPLIDSSNLKELVDPVLGNSYFLEELQLLIIVAAMCVHSSPSERPQMSEVVQLLQRDVAGSSIIPTKTPKLLRTYSEKLVVGDDQRAAKGFNELKRRMALVLEANKKP